MNDLLKTIIASIDDCAALGSADDARALAVALWRLSCAAQRRSKAIAARLSGRIDEALRHEAQSERDIELAKGAGGERPKHSSLSGQVDFIASALDEGDEGATHALLGFAAALQWACWRTLEGASMPERVRLIHDVTMSAERADSALYEGGTGDE